MPALDPTTKDQQEAQTFAELWNDYILNYRPQEEKFFADVLGFQLPDRNDPNKPSWEELVKGSADGQIMQNRRADLQGDVQADIVHAASQVPAGANPSRMATDTTATGKLGTALATGAVAADKQVTEKRLQGMQAISALGRGQQTDAANNLATNASLASQSAINSMQNIAVNDMASSNLTGSLAGSLAGAGMYYYSKFNPPTNTGNVTNSGSVSGMTPEQRTQVVPIIT